MSLFSGFDVFITALVSYILDDTHEETLSLNLLISPLYSQTALQQVKFTFT